MIIHGRIVLLMVHLLHVFRMVEACGYAKIDAKHTMCVFKERSCSGKQLIRSGGLTCNDKHEIVRVHNELRRDLAVGRVPRQPPAMNMQEMIWDDELASIAQRWADQCRRGHDKSRNIERFQVGQNVAVTWSKNVEPPTGAEPEFPRLIRAWFDEVRGFNSRDINPFRFTKKLGHYTQMAWAETFTVGCGYAYFKDPKRGFTKIYVCNYGPRGNILDTPMYLKRRLQDPVCDGLSFKESTTFRGLCRSHMVQYPPETTICPKPHKDSGLLTPNRINRPPPMMNSISQHSMPQAMMKFVKHSTRMFMNTFRPFMNFAQAINPFRFFSRPSNKN